MPCNISFYSQESLTVPLWRKKKEKPHVLSRMTKSSWVLIKRQHGAWQSAPQIQNAALGELASPHPNSKQGTTQDTGFTSKHQYRTLLAGGSKHFLPPKYTSLLMPEMIIMEPMKGTLRAEERTPLESETIGNGAHYGRRSQRVVHSRAARVKDQSERVLLLYIFNPNLY